MEIFLINEGRYGHKNRTFDSTDAIHMHGYSFYVIAQERHGIMNENVKLVYNDETPKGIQDKLL